MKPYYLVASLPTLVLGEPPPLDAAGLLSRCEHLLGADDRAELALALEGRWAESSAEFLRRWRNADTQLRNAVARIRAARRAADLHGALREHEGFDVCIEKAATDAYTRPNPLERELFLDRYRWQILDDLSRATPFGVEALLAYAVKLRLALRWAAIQDEAGRARLNELIEGMEEKAKTENGPKG